MTIATRDKGLLAEAIGNTDVGKLHEWCRGLLEDGREQRRPHEAQWWENLATFAGDLWVQFDPTRKELYELNKPDYRVRLPVNLAQPAIRTEYAKLLKNRPIPNCVARSNDRADLNSAEVGDSLLNNYAEEKFKLPKIRRRVAQWAFLCGAGGCFVDYDPTKFNKIEVPVDLDGNPVFTESEVEQLKQVYRAKKKGMKTTEVLQGDLEISALGPFRWVFDFSKEFVEESNWVIIDQVLDVDEVWRRWGVDVEPTRIKFSTMERRLYTRAGLPLKDTKYKSTYQRLAEVHRLYVKPGHRYFPNGAHIVFTEDSIIHAEEFPFVDRFGGGELPLSVMGHIFDVTSQHPTSVLEQIKPLVLELSKTVSQMIENRNMMANPPWVEYRQNRIEGEIQNRPGLRLQIDYMPNVPEPHPIQMPDLPQYVHNLPPLIGERILEVTGQNETSQGQVPPGARSGVAIAYLTEENDTKLGPTVQEWEEMNERVSGQILSRMAQFYTIPQTAVIYKPHSDPEVFDFIGTQLNGIAGVKIQTGSALPRSKAARQQFILDLYDRGLVKNPRTIKDMLEVGQGEAEEWEKDMTQAERENRRMADGQYVEVQEWHNHEAHLYVIHDFMKSAEWDEMSEQAQAPYIEHEAQHQGFIRLQQQNMAAQQEPARGNNPTQSANGQNQPPPVEQYSSPDDIGGVAEASAVAGSLQ